MYKLFLILPALLLLSACGLLENAQTSTADALAQATAAVNDVQTNVSNVVADVKAARDQLLEKKRQLDDAMAKVRDAKAAVDKLLGSSEPGAATAELAQQKSELEAKLAEAEAASAKLQIQLDAAK